MPIAGVKASSPPGTKAGAKAGNLAGQKTDVTVATQTYGEGNNKGGTIEVGTIPTSILTVPLKGIELDVGSLKAVKGATFPVNVELDGDALLASDYEISSTGTYNLDPDQNKQVADQPIHNFTLKVGSPSANGGGTIGVTPTFTGLSD